PLRGRALPDRREQAPRPSPQAVAPSRSRTPARASRALALRPWQLHLGALARQALARQALPQAQRRAARAPPAQRAPPRPRCPREPRLQPLQPARAFRALALRPSPRPRELPRPARLRQPARAPRVPGEPG